ncbi:MAG: inorganic pyrophosphatase [bacterium TMED88]|nr:inorganic pyrophosphatase [Deltaproteobacteria bacterium]OUV24979.1 MAG: inorganic pyrophosphatase [bacterium TMED88]
MSERESFEWSRPHPWHGVKVGPNPPELVHAFIEITPFDRVKYELDKHTGFLRVDRPQKTSSLPPNLYGFIPRTFCGERVAALLPGSLRGDGDPLDICIFSDRPISRAEVLLDARVVGGFPMIDGGEADDKIVAILENDAVWGNVRDISELPDAMVNRLRHYFANYKSLPGEKASVQIDAPYGVERAEQVVTAAMEDYRELHPE